MVEDLRCRVFLFIYFFLTLTASKRENHVNICHWRAPLAKSCNRPAPCVIRLVRLRSAQTQIEEGTLSIWMQVVPAAATSSCSYWFFCPQLYNRSSVLGLSLNLIVWRASVSHKSRKAFWLIWNRISIDCVWQPLWRDLCDYWVKMLYKSVGLWVFFHLPMCSRWLS